MVIYRIILLLFAWGAVLGECQWGSAQPVEFWMEESNAPYSHLNDNGELEGMWFDIANEMVKNTNLQVRWQAAPWKRLFVTVARTPNTVVFGILRKPEREETFIFIGPMTERRVFLFKLKKRSDIKIQVLDDAKAYAVGGLRGAFHTEILNAQGVETENVASSIQNVKKLSAGRIDLAVMEESTFTGGLQQAGLEYQDFEKVLLVDSRHYYISMHKDTDREIVDTLQQRARQIDENGTLQRIKESYLHGSARDK